MFFLNDKEYTFPDIQKCRDEEYEEGGIIAIGGDLHTQRLINAYKQGIFPWFSENDPILWWSPDIRAVLFIDDLYVSKSLKKLIKKDIFEIKFNNDFESVIENCQNIKRKDKGTWITEGMKKAYISLFEQGYAHCIEVYFNNELVGGLYGVSVSGIFCGESMFSKKSNASKIAIYYLVQKLKFLNINFIDCQVQNEHLKSLGVVEISRNEFFELINKSSGEKNIKLKIV